MTPQYQDPVEPTDEQLACVMKDVGAGVRARADEVHRRLQETVRKAVHAAVEEQALRQRRSS